MSRSASDRPPWKPVALGAIQDSHIGSVGPKAANLARLMRCGLPVPDGFCVPAEAYLDHVGGAEVAERIEAVSGASGDEGDELPAALAELRRTIVDAPMAEGAVEAIAAALARLTEGAGEATVAVRSSATSEDLPGRSGAGQHETVLGVAGLDACLAAVKQCWASLWSDRAYAYRSAGGIDHRRAAMGVIVQRMVAAESAGVLFTADPATGAPGRMVIESVYGLGQTLVGGEAEPDRIVLSRPGLDVVESRVGAKAVRRTLEPAGGVRRRRVTATKRRQPSLDGTTARRLGELAITAEVELGVPLDIEWAVSGGDVLLLQARPITALPQPETADRQIWTNLNTGEVMPDVASPMTWSIIEPIGHTLVSGAFASMGMDVSRLPIFGLVAGRAYFNLNTVIACLREIPGADERALTEAFGGGQKAAATLGRIRLTDEDLPDVDFRWAKLVRELPGNAKTLMSYTPAHARRVLLSARRRTRRLAERDVESMTDGQVVDCLRSDIRWLTSADEILDATGLSPMYGAAVYALCRRWFGADGDALAARLLAGMGNNDAANAGLELWRLAVSVTGRPALRRAVTDADGFDDLRRRAERTDDGREFLRRWDAFLAEHGHHCRGELELMNPRWSERPDRVLEQLRSYVEAVGRDDFLTRYRQAARRRREADEEVRRRLRNPLKRAAFRFLVHRARHCGPLRENIKSETVRWIAAARRALLALGARLADCDRLGRADDVFFLTFDELDALVHHGDSGARQTVAARRAEHERNVATRPPPVVVGQFAPAAAADCSPPAEGVLAGLGASPGVVTGPARVILRAADDQVRSGEVLVAPFTDPGWTPYFLNAAAIVMDLGGMLSHGSIIAREYGIPAVVNVTAATRTIRTGQLLRVDGHRGLVEVLDQ